MRIHPRRLWALCRKEGYQIVRDPSSILIAFVLPVLLLSPPAMTISGVDTRRLLCFAVALPLVMLIVSPAILQFLPRQ